MSGPATDLTLDQALSEASKQLKLGAKSVTITKQDNQKYSFSYTT